MMKESIHTSLAPKAIGIYSQAIKCGNWVFLSGQLPLHPETMVLVQDSPENAIRQCLNNLQAVCIKAGGNLTNIVKLTIYLTDLNWFSLVNQVMESYFKEPYPARAVVEVKALPKAAPIEIEGLMVL